MQRSSKSILSLSFITLTWAAACGDDGSSTFETGNASDTGPTSATSNNQTNGGEASVTSGMATDAGSETAGPVVVVCQAESDAIGPACGGGEDTDGSTGGSSTGGGSTGGGSTGGGSTGGGDTGGFVGPDDSGTSTGGAVTVCDAVGGKFLSCGVSEKEAAGIQSQCEEAVEEAEAGSCVDAVEAWYVCLTEADCADITMDA